jgi:hypothetical protein
VEHPEPSWKELLRCALLGTDRYPLPKELENLPSSDQSEAPASKLLRALARHTPLQLGALPWVKVSDLETE